MTQHIISKYCSRLLLLVILTSQSVLSQNQACPFDGIYFNPDSIKKSPEFKVLTVIKANTKYLCSYKKGEVEVTNRLCTSFGVKISFLINSKENGDLIAAELYQILLNKKDFSFYKKHIPVGFVDDFLKGSESKKDIELPTKKYDTFHISLERQKEGTTKIVIDLYLT